MNISELRNPSEIRLTSIFSSSGILNSFRSVDLVRHEVLAARVSLLEMLLKSAESNFVSKPIGKTELY